MPLTDVQIRNLNPGPKTYKKYDGRGLFIEVRTSGNKIFRFKYFFNGKHQLLTLGHYPEISLKRARDQHQQARIQIAQGINPAQEKKSAKEHKTKTFKETATEWYNNTKSKWTTDHANTVWRRLEVNIFPWLGDRPIDQVTTKEILEVLRKVENRGAQEVARRLCQTISQIFIFAVASGITDGNPAGDLHKALKPRKKRNLPAITDPERIRTLLQAIEGFEGSFIVYCALRFAPLVFVRPGELRKAEWAEIDWNGALWTIPAHRMKKKREHLVPLSRQALTILNDLHPLTKESRYIFPTVRSLSRPMSENTLSAALQRLGFSKEEHCPHGFRTMASTRLHEMGWNSKTIETQLAHIDQNKIRGIYNRAKYLEERTRMMQAWADYLDALKQEARVLPFVAG